MSSTIMVLLVIVAVLFFLLAGGLLLAVSRGFKILNSNYKKSLLVLLLCGIASSIFGILFGLIGTGLVPSILVSIATFFVFLLLYKKYYQTSFKKSLGVYIVFSLISFILIGGSIVYARSFLYSPFMVSGQAMSPAYNEGEYVLINKINKEYMRGDVVVMRYEEEKYMIKRIVGLPGEKISIGGGNILINDQILSENNIQGEIVGNVSVQLGSDEYFMLGDKLEVSLDSRHFGPIPRSDIEGKILLR